MACHQSCVRPTPVQAHCGSCHLTFGGVTGFDKHRRNGTCLEPASFGYELTGRGIWRKPMPQDRVFPLSGNAADGSEPSGGTCA